MEQWDQDYIDLEKPGYFRFHKDGMGEFVFGCPSRKYVLSDILDLFQRRRQSGAHGHC